MEVLRPDIVRLDSARLITSSEGDVGDRLSEKLIKQMTGGDTITARGLYQEEREFKITGKIWFATNHNPKILGTDDAIWRRVWLMPFDVTIPKNKTDPKIIDKLMKESPGIFNWMIEGLKKYYANGHTLRKPIRVQIALEHYKTESDIVRRFINECCNIALDDLKCKVEKEILWNAFKTWCYGIGENLPSKTRFTQTLKEMGIREDGGRRIKIGVCLKEHP